MARSSKKQSTDYFKTKMESKKLKLVTHDGSFHADDIFATATLSILLEKKGVEFEVIRTREPEIIDSADYVYDVGGIHDESTNRFDHHQVGGAGSRVDGIPYSSFGLVWKKHGLELAGGEKEASIVEKKLIEPIDGPDNGVAVFEAKGDIYPYTIQRFFEGVMHPTWQEDVGQTNENFFKCVDIAKLVLSREIKHAQDKIKAEDYLVEYFNKAEDKRIVVFQDSYPFGDFFESHPETLFIVSPRRHDGMWSLIALRDGGVESFKNRKNLPATWGGLYDAELQSVTGVADAVFCHRGLFLAVAKTKEGAIELARKALNE